MGRNLLKVYEYIMGCVSTKVGPDAEDKYDSGPKENGSGVALPSSGRSTPQTDKDSKIIRGDITRKYEARKAREDMLRQKQLRITSAAEELSHRIMEERDRLSLNSRSRTTSRATSRTGSPSLQKKHVTFSTISAHTSVTTKPDGAVLDQPAKTFGNGTQMNTEIGKAS